MSIYILSQAGKACLRIICSSGRLYQAGDDVVGDEPAGFGDADAGRKAVREDSGIFSVSRFTLSPALRCRYEGTV